MTDKYDTLKQEYNVIQKLWMPKWMRIWATRKMTMPVIIPKREKRTPYKVMYLAINQFAILFDGRVPGFN